ncbi:MAG: RNA 2',3'-cyclic phosphodiesterase [Bacteroidota bacterium]
MKIRLFIALILNDKILQEIVDLRKEFYPEDNSARWEKKERLHITLKFLGEVDSSLVSEIDNKLESIFKNYNQIDFIFSKFRVIKKHSIPKILWLGIKRNNLLESLYSDIDIELSKLGFEREERKYNPHITLLRMKGKEKLSKIERLIQNQIEVNNTFIDEAALIKSELHPKGSTYTRIKSYKLNKGGFNG